MRDVMRLGLVVLLVVGAAVRAGATLVCGEVEANTYTTGIQSTPMVGMDPAGGVVVTWGSAGSGGDDTSDRSIQARVYDAAAQANGPEFQVNTYTPGRQRRPAVAVEPGTGRFLVVWESVGSPGTDTSLQSIQARLFDPSGTPVAAQMQVNTHTTGMQYNPGVAADGSGGFVVVWESATSPGTDSSSYSILGRTVTGQGVPAGSDFQVNVYTTSYQVEPAIMSDPNGGFVVLWVSNGSAGGDADSTSVVGRRLDATGVPTGSEFQVNAYTTSFQDQPRAAPDGRGGFVVVWRSDGSAGTDQDYGSVQARQFTGAGAPAGAQVQVNTYTQDDQGYPGVAPDGTGGFLVTWESLGSVGTDTDGNSVQGQRYDGGLGAVESQFQVNGFTSGDQKRPRVGGDGLGGFFVAWQSAVGSGVDGADSIELARLHETSCTTTTTSTSTSTSTTATSASSTSSTSTTTATSTSIVGTSSTSTTVAGTSTTSTTVAGTSTTSTTVVGSTTVTTTTTSTTSTTEPTSTLSARALRVTEARGRRTGRATLSSRDPAVGVDVPLDDVVRDGGSLHVVSRVGAFDETVTLDAVAWRRTKRGIKHRGADGARVTLKPGKRLKVSVKGRAFPLGDTSPAPVVVALRLAGRRLCFEFADGTLNPKRGRFVSKEAAAPSTCDEELLP